MSNLKTKNKKQVNKQKQPKWILNYREQAGGCQRGGGGELGEKEKLLIMKELSHRDEK